MAPDESGICGRGSACTPPSLHSPYCMLVGESYPARKWRLWAGSSTLPLFGPRRDWLTASGGRRKRRCRSSSVPLGIAAWFLPVIGGDKTNVCARGSRHEGAADQTEDVTSSGYGGHQCRRAVCRPRRDWRNLRRALPDARPQRRHLFAASGCRRPATTALRRRGVRHYFGWGPIHERRTDCRRCGRQRSLRSGGVSTPVPRHH